MDLRFSICDLRLPQGHGCKPVRLLSHATNTHGLTPVALTHLPIGNRKSAIGNGFTLVELLVTCALVTVLMLACAQVFSIASKTIGGGQALGAAVRDAQAAQSVFARDFAAAASPTVSPAMYIVSSRVGAFRNANDQRTDVDGNIYTFDFDGDAATAEETIPAATYNFRNHRVDTVGFFALDKYARQTGNTNLVDVDASREAWIWYGHLNLANNAGSWNANTHPGSGDDSTNPNNHYATQWALGRVAMLLKANPTNGFVPRTPTPGGNLSPLTFGVVGGPYLPLIEFRYDLAQTTMADFRQIILATSTPVAYYRMAFEDNNTIGRYRASAFQTRPLTPAAAAQQVPIFLPGCTQFIVEFAGDFMAQDGPTPGAPWDKNGDSNAGNDTDGVIDYVAGTAQIRWYGYPRDTNGDGVIRADQGDVAPVQDTLRVAPAFQEVLPTGSLQAANYNYANATSLGTYVASWSPGETNRPKMIRITLVIDRPEAEGKLFDGQSFEYVFNVGY